MSDAVDGGMWALGGAIAGKAIDALVRLVGSRRDRAASERNEDDANERAAEIALRIAGEEREETTRVRHRAETCEERLAKMDRRMVAVESALEEHARCAPRIAELEHEVAYLREEQRLSRGMLSDLMRNASTPPSGLYVPDDVRAALAQEDHDHG